MTGRLPRLARLTEKLSALEQRYRQALDAAEVGVWEWVVRLDKLAWDTRMYQIFDITAAEFDGTLQFFKDRVLPEDLTQVLDTLTTALSSDKAFSIQFRIKNKQGIPVVIYCKGKSRVDDNGAQCLAGICFRENHACAHSNFCPLAESKLHS